MSVLYDFPQKAVYGKNLPKSKIYSYSNPSSRVKELFVKEVERIIWSYKLSPKTINIPANGFVQEIQVMTIELKKSSLTQDVLESIDKAIPSPIYFELKRKNATRYMAAYKRQNEADKSKWVMSSYFESDWIKDTLSRESLPIALNLNVLYQSMIRNLISINQLKSESMIDFVDRVEEINTKEKEFKKLELRMNREKQYNRKVEMHTKLGNLKKEIAVLTS